MKKAAIGLMLVGIPVIGLAARQILPRAVDQAALKQLQGEWVVEEWTGYKPLAAYEGYLSVSTNNSYAGSTLTVSGTSTTWQLKISPDMKGLLLGLFSEGKDLVLRTDGDARFYTDKATIKTLQAGNPGTATFVGAPGEDPHAKNDYAAIWSLQNGRLIICKAKTAGEKCAASLDIRPDDFFNTRIVLRRADKRQ
jgi:hypothetical protein